MNSIALYVHVPCATFRTSRSREYGKTYPVPPFSTAYGMLLSLVGETDAKRHYGVKLAIAMLSQPQKSTVLRKMRRFKEKEYSHKRNTTVEHQEILTDIKFIVWVESSEELENPTLATRIEQAKAEPAAVKRFGCLYLGESNDLVNSIKLAQKHHLNQNKQWLVKNNRGNIILPYWVDHEGSKGTRWQRYYLEELELNSPPDNSWTVVQTE